MPLPFPAPELLGIDIGGTAIKLGRFDRQGNLLAEAIVATPQPQVPGAVCQAVVEAVAALDPERRADRVGIGLPGPTDRDGRIARLAINLPLWRRIPLADWLERSALPQRQPRLAGAVLQHRRSGAAESP